MTDRGLVVGFDLDLTLIDARPGIRAACRALADELGYPIDEDVVATCLRPIPEDMAAFVPAAEVDRVVARFWSLYGTHIAPATVPLDGAAEALAWAARGGRPLIVTAKAGEHAEATLALLGGRDAIVVGDCHGSDAKAAALAAHGAAAYVGDAPLDVRAARLAGARAVGVATGVAGAEELRAAGADAVVSSLRALPALFVERGWGPVPELSDRR